MNSAKTLSLNEVVSRALPTQMPRALHTRLRRQIVLTARRYQLDHPFFYELQREKQTARVDGFIDLAESATRALAKAREKLACSAAFREAADRATSAQYERNFWRFFPLANLERLAREAPTERARNHWLRQVENHKLREEHLKHDRAIVTQLTRAGVPEELKGELSLRQSLDVVFSRAVTEIREWVDNYRVPREGERESDAMQLVKDLSDLMERAGLTEHEAKVLLNALRGVDGIDLPSEEALAKRTLRARKKGKVARQSTRDAQPPKVPGRRQTLNQMTRRTQ